MSENPVSAEVTQDDKIIAAVGHATIIWPVLGILAPLAIWATQRQKSQFVGFQALQAAVYQMTLIVAGLVCGICYLCAYFLMIAAVVAMPLSMLFALPAGGAPSEELPPSAVIPLVLTFLVMIVFYLLFFGFMVLSLAAWAAYVGYGLYGAVASLQGKDFRYMVIGHRLERYLEQG